MRSAQEEFGGYPPAVFAYRCMSFAQTLSSFGL